MREFKVQFIRPSYQRFYEKHKGEILQRLDRCFKRGSLIAEREVIEFENRFAKVCGKKYCLSTASGTDALTLAAQIRDPKLVSTYRYRLPIKSKKKSDCALVTYMNSVVPLDINYIRKEYRFLIEDACQAVCQPLVGDVSCFSFYPAKILGGMGKGGALVTDDKAIYQVLKKFRDDHWNNIWLDEVNAAYLNVKLTYLPALMRGRQKVANYYNEHLPTGRIFNKHCLQNYLIWGDEKLYNYLRRNGIEAIWDKNDFYEGNFDNLIRIPIYAEMTEDEYKYVVHIIKNYDEEEENRRIRGRRQYRERVSKAAGATQ